MNPVADAPTDRRIGAFRVGFYTVEWIEVGQAVKLGMATGVFPDAQLLEATLAVAREIAQYPV